jgi:hypothetical protein
MTGKPGSIHRLDPTYAREAAAVRRAAYADVYTVCRRCGRTWSEYARIHGVEAAAWTAGHPRPLAPEHARCNYQAGARAVNARWRRVLRSEDP